MTQSSSSRQDAAATETPVDDPIIMVPVPRSRLADVYAALGRRSPGEDPLPWQPIAIGLWRGSSWVTREVVAPAAREVARQDFAEIGETLSQLIGRSARAMFAWEGPSPAPPEHGATTPPPTGDHRTP